MIFSPLYLFLFFAVVMIGSFLLHWIANKKWGYTKKRERELEKQTELMWKEKRRKTDKNR